MRTKLPVLLLVASAAFAGSFPASAAGERSDVRERGWTVHMDNDLFTFTDQDRDYTAGFAFTLGGERARTYPLSLARALERVDAWTGFGKPLARGTPEGYALELGLLLFTPQDLGARQPLVDDRPYANLTYVASSRLTHEPERRVAYQSSLTLGILGSPLAEHLHRAVHEASGSAEPMGYAHQISAGGEPTFRYAVGRQQLLADGYHRGRPYSLRLGADASLGYLTEASAEIAFRWGRTHRPWWSSLPASSDYAGHPPVRSGRASAGRNGMEAIFDAGVKLRARLYNSFLQGQVRDSVVTYSSGQLNHVLLEAWLGVTTVLPNNLSISYTVRHQTDEIETGPGARAFTWASIGIAQRF